MSEKTMTLSEKDALAIAVALNWLFGFVNGKERDVPLMVTQAFIPLLEFCGAGLTDARED